jgi:hypothetical protein
MTFQNLYVLNTQCNIPITETNASTIKKEKKKKHGKKKFFIFFVELIQSLLKFRQSFPYTGRSQVIDESFVHFLYSLFIHNPIISSLKL